MLRSWRTRKTSNVSSITVKSEFPMLDPKKEEGQLCAGWKPVGVVGEIGVHENEGCFWFRVLEMGNISGNRLL